MIQTIDEDEDDSSYNDVFLNYVPVEQRTVLFEFVYAGISRACEYVEKRRITIEMNSMLENTEMNKVHKLCCGLPIKGRPLSPASFRHSPKTSRERWAHKLYSCSLKNTI